MKLSHLFETVNDPRQLLTQVAHELGLSTQTLIDIDDEHTNLSHVKAALDLYRLHLDTEGSAQISLHISNIEKLAMDSRPLPDGMEALEYLEETSFGELPEMKAFYDALKVVKANASKVRDAAKVSYEMYFLLQTMQKYAANGVGGNDADLNKYRSSIARAALKQLGMPLKALS